MYSLIQIDVCMCMRERKKQVGRKNLVEFDKIIDKFIIIMLESEKESIYKRQ